MAALNDPLHSPVLGKSVGAVTTRSNPSHPLHLTLDSVIVNLNVSAVYSPRDKRRRGRESITCDHKNIVCLSQLETLRKGGRKTPKELVSVRLSAAERLHVVANCGENASSLGPNHALDVGWLKHLSPAASSSLRAIQDTRVSSTSKKSLYLALASCVRTLSLETIITDLMVEGDDQIVVMPRQVLRQTAADTYH
jgi:hypothetical protein